MNRKQTERALEKHERGLAKRLWNSDFGEEADRIIEQDLHQRLAFIGGTEPGE